ncbi:MAG: hypothetical protein HC886_03090 [Leptolyngbyaceae cyanobacterium SM1_1_3]|nr:hypothetical protein [Leptolyngbyaceae cyanobacterium SM1_1_3]
MIRLSFYGAIAANGGALAGNGGLVEVSGKDSLVFRGTVDVAAVNGAAGTLLLDPDTLTIIDAADGAGTLDGELTPDTDDKLFAAVPNSGANTISVGQLEAFGSTAQIVLQADNGITIANIASDLIALNLETNLNPDNSVDPLTSGSITFIADADNDGVGNFSMNPGDTIQTNGGSVIIRGADILVGNIQTDAFVIGNVDIQGSSLRIGRIDSGAIGVFGTGRINLTATEGDIVVDSLEAGSGGIRIEAAGLFQAIGSDLEFFTIPPVDFSGVPVSLLVRAFSAQAKQVVILHNGASEPASGEPIVIAGSGTAFALGPSVDNPSAPGQLGTDATYTPFVLGSAEFPVSVSGTVGAIAVGAGSDATLVTSLQNQPFVPGLEPVPPVPDFDAASLDQLEPDADLAASLSRSATASAPTETPENPETPPTNCTAQRIELNPEGLPELRGACLEEDTEQVPAEPK